MNEPEETGFELQGFPVHEGEADLRSREPLELLASQFVEELRQGKKPSVEIYARRFPRHASRIRESFPMLALLEQARSHQEATAIRRNMPERFPFQRLGRCELLCEIGRGGMGVVFQGREADSGQIVAVKLLPWRVAVVPEWQQRFETEARIAASLRHRNIVRVHRFGQEHGYCYYVMQFVNGIGLDRIIERLQETEGVVYQDEIRRKEADQPRGFVASTDADNSASSEPPISEPAVQTEPEARRRRLTRNSWKGFTQIAIQTAQALRCAHAAGILHNDIKPGNILLDADGRVGVSDFGLSQPIDERQTAAGPRLMGTLRYMAPERFHGAHDARSDIYSLGITLYELVTLSAAFAADSEDQLVAAIQDQAPQPPRRLQPELPRGLQTVIQNCIARDPAHRYATADALLADLLRFTQGRKIRSLRPSPLTWLLSFLRRPRASTLE